MSLRTQFDTDMILEHLPVGVALLDVQQPIILRANRQFQTNMNTLWNENQIIGRPMTEWLPGLEELGMLEIFHAVATTGIPFHIDEFSYPSPDGQITYWNWTLTPIHDDEEHIVHLLLTTREITEIVRARQQSEQAYSSLQHTNRQVEAERKRLEVIETVSRSVQQSLDATHISKAAIAAINDHFDVAYVYAHVADPVQKTLHMLHIQPLPPDEEAFSFARHVPYDSNFGINRALTQRTPIVIEDFQLFPELKNGSPLLSPSDSRAYVCIPLWYGEEFEGTLTATFKYPIAEHGPEVGTLIGCGIHIAAALAHARLHTDLENERTRLRAILDQLPEGILITESSSGSISYVNAAAATIFGMPATQLFGLPLHQFPHAYQVASVNGKFFPPWNFILIRALSGEVVNGQDTIITRHNGSRTFILSSAAPLRNDDGVITGAVIVFQDVTRQKSLEQQKNEFLSIASHELRTPVTAIQGFAEILQFQMEQKGDIDPAGRRALAVISEQTDRLSQLIQEMLDLSRIENVQMLLTCVPHNLVAILAHVVESQASTSRNHTITLILEGLAPGEELLATVDENRIVQVFSNLINNAIKYSPGGSIEVGLRHSKAEPNECLIWVKDHGTGIPPADMPHIFKRFHRSSAVDSSISGLGIGLYLVKDLVTRHGGSVWAESTEGVGSTFYVKLPLGTESTRSLDSK